MKFLAFDIEIAKVIPPGEPWRDHRPFGISVAATLAENEEVKLWYGEGRPDGRPWDKMPQSQVQVLVAYLEAKVTEGYTIATYNGLGFDFSVLAEESGLHDRCVLLALGPHIDPMWHFFCENGYVYRGGLDATARGMGVPTKIEGMSGDLAPVLWQAGEYDKVKRYVAQDAKVTLEVVEKAQAIGGLGWLTRSGRPRSWWPAAGRLLTAQEAMLLPLPEPPTWIKDPWPREQFTGWMIGEGP